MDLADGLLQKINTTHAQSSGLKTNTEDDTLGFLGLCNDYKVSL